MAAAARVVPAVAPAAPDLGRLAAASHVPVVAQAADPGDPGARTGAVPVAAIAAAGAVGSLVNHSEHRVTHDEAADLVARLHAVRLAAVVCAGTLDEAAALATLRPEFVAIEPPELIGGPVSVSTARPELVADAVSAVRGVAPATRVLCGAGIRDRRDVARALELGAVGILVASAVTRAPDPRAALRELLAGFGRAATPA